MVGFLLTQEKDTDVLSALLWSCVSVLGCISYEGNRLLRASSPSSRCPSGRFCDGDNY